MNEQKKEEEKEEGYPLPPVMYKRFRASAEYTEMPPLLAQIAKDGWFEAFGVKNSVKNDDVPLSDFGVRDLYVENNENGNNNNNNVDVDDGNDNVKLLLSLNKKCLKTYIELLDCTVTNPGMAQIKVEEIRVMLFNMHHILNSKYRPHLALETLIEYKKEQVHRRIKFIESTEQIFSTQIINLLSQHQQMASNLLSSYGTNNNTNSNIETKETEINNINNNNNNNNNNNKTSDDYLINLVINGSQTT